METWPSILPAPTLSFNGDNKGSVIQTDMESGRKRRRRRFSSELRSYKATWEMSDYEFGMFQSWFLYKISGGADAFSISIPTGGEGMKTVTASFVEGKYAYNHKNVLFWNVSATLEVEEPDVWTADIFDALILIGDPVALEQAAADLGLFVNN